MRVTINLEGHKRKVRLTAFTKSDEGTEYAIAHFGQQSLSVVKLPRETTWRSTQSLRHTLVVVGAA